MCAECTAWAAMLGNPHNITAELYSIYLDQARSTLAALRASHPTVATMFTPPTLLLPKERGREHSLALIDVDIPRTFPTLSFFAHDGPLHEPLQNILFVSVTALPVLALYLLAVCLHAR